ncbi:hypothetical protein BDQ17DRAFT_1332723 [Cyathus striatus]|nr:hypothetical protein BDQ17DRAFT_1332723 [Cyathus striatus]
MAHPLHLVFDMHSMWTYGPYLLIQSPSAPTHVYTSNVSPPSPSPACANIAPVPSGSPPSPTTSILSFDLTCSWVLGLVFYIQYIGTLCRLGVRMVEALLWGSAHGCPPWSWNYKGGFDCH